MTIRAARFALMLNLRLALTFAVLTLAAHSNAIAAPGFLPQPEEDIRQIQKPTILYRQLDDKGVMGLRLVDWDGQNDRSYMYDPTMQFIVVESSFDGSRFATVAYTRDEYRTFIFDVNTGRALEVTPNLGPEMTFHHPKWSRDGKWLVLEGGPMSGIDVYKMEVSTGRLVNLTKSKEMWNQSPSWSPVEDRIVFDAAPREDTISDIYVMDADGKNRVNLTNSPEFHDRFPVWSPDGKRIAFTSDIDTEFPHYDLFVMDADGSNLERLTRSAEWDYEPSWSPNGKWILFSAGLYDSGIPWDLYRIHVETKEIVRMTHGQPGGSSPTWVLAGAGRWLSVSPTGRLPSVLGAVEGVSLSARGWLPSEALQSRACLLCRFLRPCA